MSPTEPATRQHAFTGPAMPQLPEPSHAERVRTLISHITNLGCHPVDDFPQARRLSLRLADAFRARFFRAARLPHQQYGHGQPWQYAATIIADEGMRPGEVFVMRWEYVLLGEEESGLIRMVDGKSKAARRVLPITPRVYALLKARHKDQGHPSEGWVFPSQSKCGHLEVQTAKRQHATALKDSGVAPFVPYVLRHTALTRLGKAARGDVFALAKIAGHSSITITQKYVHPEEETIGEVFSRLAKGVPMTEKQVGTKSGTVKKKAAKRLAAGIAK